MSPRAQAERIWQLGRLPGGPAAAIPDYFGALLAAPPTRSGAREHWRLHGEAALELDDGRLDALLGEQRITLATLPRALLDSAAQAGLSPLLLGLLALAEGEVDGARALKRHLPQVDKAARELMLMTACRLCG